MWDDVVIGTGRKGNSSIKVFAIKGNHSISENQVSYWISDLFLGVGMTIFKNAEEGQHLTDMISNGNDIDQINEYLNGLVLKHIDKDKLTQLIRREMKKSYESGRSDKAAEFRSVLGID